jgi:hypothetical protein
VSKPHAHPSFALIGGCKWYMVLHGEVVTLRPIELAPARGSAECVHCGLECWTYCRSCRRAVAPECFEEHERDHTEWRTRTSGTWTKVER